MNVLIQKVSNFCRCTYCALPHTDTREGRTVVHLVWISFNSPYQSAKTSSYISEIHNERIDLSDANIEMSKDLGKEYFIKLKII